MDKPLRRFPSNLNEHLSDDQLESSFHGLSFAKRLIARLHLVKCRECQLRKKDFEESRADRTLKLYREVFDSRKLPYPEQRREEFIRRLDLQLQTTDPLQTPVPHKQRAFRFPTISFPELPPMNPALAACMVFSFAAVLSFYFWWQQRTPQISSNALLVRAEKWDGQTVAATPGVVYQAVRITTTNQSKKETVARSIYRDVQGKRQPKQVKLDNREEQLRNVLVQAGMDWDEPLSASGYQNWHDRQHVREDHIARAGAHLLRLTTTVPYGLVSEQSLTVRDTDFHPVQRTVALRDNGTVEIAEVDFKILPWSEVDAHVFEPLSSTLPTVATNHAHVLPFPRLPESLSEEQLDEAELGARLVLNQLHADTGEPLILHRTAHNVIVDGLVETEERKRELQAVLRTVPHVTASIQSVGDLKNRPDASGNTTTSISVASMPDQPSPLATYLEARGRSISEVNILAQRLFNNAWTISQESKEIVDLETRFGPEDQKTVFASATLVELIYSHHERLDAALKHERELLADAQSISPASRDSSAPKTSSLLDAANRNLALSKELTQTNNPAVRSAEKILAEMSLTMDDLTAEAHEAYGKSQRSSTLSGKK